MNPESNSDLLVEALHWDIIANDDILPSQYFARSNQQPESKLFACILWDAIKCARLGVDSFTKFNNYHIMKLMNDALHWIAVETPDPGAFSFEFICDNLHLNSNWLRKEIYTYLFKVVYKDKSVNTISKMRFIGQGNHVVEVKSRRKASPAHPVKVKAFSPIT